jgi:transcriptional regulator with XRE-family HTH domain
MSASAGASAGKQGKGAKSKPPQKRVYRTSAGSFERLEPARLALAEKQLRELFGRNVREARQRAGLTQADVGDIIGSGQPFVGAVERGEQNVQLATIVRLAYAVRTDPGALLLGDGAVGYSLETLVRLVSALNTYLQATIAEKGAARVPADMLTIIPRPVEMAPLQPMTKPARKR